MSSMPIPGMVWGSYPQRPSSARVGRVRAQGRYARRVAQVRTCQQAWAALDEAAFAAALLPLRARLARDGLGGSVLTDALAAVCVAVQRTLGFLPYDTQCYAALVMLDNRLAEMATGEGKTLAAALAAACAALAGVPVHVLTANDYLVARDAVAMQPLYAALGLSAGFVSAGMAADARRAAYAQAVCYVTASELVFDYLKDLPLCAAPRFAPGEVPLLRGLCMALLDEADSLLLDEALTPLILSRRREDATARAFYFQALQLATALQAGRDYRLDSASTRAQLTAAGRDVLLARSQTLGGRWRVPAMACEAVESALAAQALYRRDVHYLVRDGEIVIIDEVSGRLAEGRVWSRGLHTLIELKEGCKSSGESDTLAQITYQRFFVRYHRLCGMSGTLSEARTELRTVYGLDVAAVPLRMPSRRKTRAVRLYRDHAALWAAVCARVAQLAAEGRPVLVGTASVAESAALSAQLAAAGLTHQRLDAQHHAAEADIVARAGEAGAITVATNMAGRGTDIPLGAAAHACGGLHVLVCQHNRSRRIDRQLEGRAARQGDPGSVETWLSLDTPNISGSHLAACCRRLRGDAEGRIAVPAAWLASWLRLGQWQMAQSGQRQRRQMLRADRAWARGLGFAGKGE
ncbi:MAG: hypothetical protein ACRC2B_16755 [Rubrivivax sp.]